MVSNTAGTKKKVEVVLMGERFSVRSDRDQNHIEHLSRIVNDQLEAINTNTRTMSAHHVALLAALNIADDLARTKEALAHVEESLKMEKVAHQEMKASLAVQARATLQEVESALSFLPAEYRKKDERADTTDEIHAASSNTHDVAER